MSALTVLDQCRIPFKGDYDKTKLRKIWNLFAFVPAIISLCFISLCGCNSAAVITLICIAYGMRGFGSAVQTERILPELIDMITNDSFVLTPQHLVEIFQSRHFVTWHQDLLACYMASEMLAIQLEALLFPL